MKIKEIDINSESYPESLKGIKKPPQTIFLIGDESILKNECLSIVGSRCCTKDGAEIAYSFARNLAKKRHYNCKWNGKRNR